MPHSRASAGSGNDVGTVNGSRSSFGSRPGSGRGATTASARPAGGSRPSSGHPRGAPPRVGSASDPPSARDDPPLASTADPHSEADDDDDCSAFLTTEELELQIADLRRRIAEDDAAPSVFVVAAPSDDPTDADADADADAFDDLRAGTLDDRRLAVAREDALDGLIESLARARFKPTDKAMLEIEEREADRARRRVDLTTYLHRLKRDPRVEFPANFAAVAGDAYKAAKMREELRATGKITLASAGDPPGVDGVPVPVPDPFGDDDAAGAAETRREDETRRKIAEGMARIARLDEKLRARDSNRRVDSNSEDAEATRRREATIAARSARRREKLAKLRRALRGDDAYAMGGAAARNAVGAFARRFLRLTPEEDALAERLLAEFDAAGDSDLDVEFDAAGDSDLDDIVASASARTRVRNPFEPSTSDARDRPGSRDAGANENATSSATSSDASFGARLAAIDVGLRAFGGAPGGYFRSASRASSRPASAAASDVSLSVSVSVSVSASEDASIVFSDERLRAADEEVDRRLRLLKTTDPLPERLDADEMATLMMECRQSSAADPETRGGDR